VVKFVVEFQGDSLAQLPYGMLPEVMVTASSGSLLQTFAEAVPDGVAGHWRAMFDLAAPTADPVELRLFLKAGDRTLTETWLYQYHPPAS
jgi:glucans biosynthesis protein